jgi:hypothetical protein
MSPPPGPVRIRKRRRRKKKSLLSRYWWVGLLLLAIGSFPAAYWWMRPRVASGEPLEGYIGEAIAFREELAQYYGSVPVTQKLERQFAEAADLADRQQFTGAITLLESIEKAAAVPVVFNDLGVLYARVGDRARTINAFREALSRDAGYRPVRANLERLQKFVATSVDPVTREIEPNNSVREANLIAPVTSVEGEIGDMPGDVDYYRFTSPPAPRDVLSIRVTPSSPTLVPSLRVLDENSRLLESSSVLGSAGEVLTDSLAPEPNSTFYIQVWGAESTYGTYHIEVRPSKAADAYEPNDDLLNPTPIEPGRIVEAAILDPRDHDFFSFVAVSPTATVALHNRGTTLVPSLTGYGPDQRPLAAAPMTQTPGADLTYKLPVVPGKRFYIQVSGAEGTAGPYSLSLQ